MSSEPAAASVTAGPFVPLPASFYRPSAKTVAPRLLGHFLVRNTPDGPAGGLIVETEAYLANDPSCHGFRKETRRNRSMYGPPGCAYVYFIYGNYYCFNAVCCPAGVAEAVLVRAIEPSFGVDWMRANRPVAEFPELTAGPAKFCLALDIGREMDGASLCDTTSPVFVARNPHARAARKALGPVVNTTRIGISVAQDWPLRYYLEGSRYVSKRVFRVATPSAKRY
jgi:DNA-3-methyladenine glycosylase